jgi:hypothetical protein
MSSLNKKGISQIVTIVLFIVMLMASIALIASAILSLTKETTDRLAPVTNCLDLQRSPPTIESAAISEGFLEVSVKRKLNKISSLDFIIETSSGTERYTCGYSCGGHCILQGANQEKTFYFENQDATSITLLANGNCELDKLDL